MAVGIGLPAKVKLSAKLGRKPHHCGKRFADSAAETRQGPHRALGYQRLDFLGGELAARHDFPDRKVALLALELAIGLLHLAAALGTRSLQGEENGSGVIAVIHDHTHLTSETIYVDILRSSRMIYFTHL